MSGFTAFKPTYETKALNRYANSANAASNPTQTAAFIFTLLEAFTWLDHVLGRTPL